MRNETEFIKCSNRRYLTAKASKFLSRCVDIAAKQNGITRYHEEFRPTKERLSKIIHSLFIDENKSIEEIKQLIKNRKILLQK
jgi:hypothetical protein